MREQEIQWLVVRFFDGETTLEEERRLYAFFQRDDVPAELQEYQGMFRAYASIAPKATSPKGSVQKGEASKRVERRAMRPVWLRVAGIAAACLMVVSLIGYTLYIKDAPKPHEKSIVVKYGEPTPVEKGKGDRSIIQNPLVSVENPREEVVKQSQRPVVEKPIPRERVAHAKVKDASAVQNPSVATHQVSVSAGSVPPVAIKASAEVKADTSYQAPFRVDEFIARLAAYHHIEEEVLGDSGNDSTMKSVAYVFPDNEKVRLFDRLLQVACWYSCDSPGYQLTISQQQLLFTLEDRRLQRRYLWLAERIGGNRIILYATHSPTDATVSSERYQNFREKITHTNQNIEL